MKGYKRKNANEGQGKWVNVRKEVGAWDRGKGETSWLEKAGDTISEASRQLDGNRATKCQHMSRRW